MFKAACSPFSQVRCTTTGHEMEASAVRSSATGTPLRLRGCRQPGSSAVLPCKRQQQQRAQNACPDSQAWVAHLQEECARYLTGRAYKRSKRKKGMSAVPMSLGERMRSPAGWFLCLRVVPSGATAAVLAVA